MEPIASSSKRRRAVTPGTRPLPQDNKYGVNAGGLGIRPEPADRFTKLYNKRIGWVRYWVPWDKVAPHKPLHENDYNWSVVDADISNMVRSGLNVYLNTGGAPSWAIEGKPADKDFWPAYEGLSCMTQTPPYMFIGEVPGGLEKNPWCGQYKPDVLALTEYLKALVKRYSNPPFNVQFFGVWNEPNYDIFWHFHDDVFPLTIDGGWPKSANLSIVKEVLVPGYRAMKEANPNIQVVGPEVDGPLFLKWVLEEEEKQGPVADVLAFHVYGDHLYDGLPYDISRVFEEIGTIDPPTRYDQVIKEYGKGRPVWLTETYIGNPDDAPLFFQRVFEHEWIKKVFIYPVKHDSTDDDWSP